MNKTSEALMVSDRQALKTFLENNPDSTIEANNSPKVSFRIIKRPWGDTSLSLLVPDEEGERREAFISALNGVILPHQLSAIYHRAKRSLEVIWTAYLLPSHQDAVAKRSFSFSYEDVTHACEFAASSPELLSIAKEAVFYGASTTGYRNLQSHELYLWPSIAQNKAKIDEGDRLGHPISFYIHNLDWDEERVMALVRQLNFYLLYFDALSPTVLIHEKSVPDFRAIRSRYVDGKFPDHIKSRKLNPILISFWSAAAEGDNARRFLHYYRIIEYVSYFHLESSIKTGVKRALSGPNALGNMDTLTDSVISLIRDAKSDEYARFKSTIIELVEERHIWREVCLNMEKFSSELTFDGGFKLKALVDAKATKLGSYGMDNFVTCLRDIRNGLSHGRDQKSGQIILPTALNLNKLEAWVNLAATAAAEVVLYEGIS